MGILFTFDSIHAALAAEKAATRAAGEPGAEAPGLVPLPPQVRSDCGFGLLVSTEAPEALRLTGATSLWRALPELPPRKGKRYERIDPNP